MEKELWDEHWELGEVGFHQQEVHPLLIPSYMVCSLLRVLCVSSEQSERA